MKLALLSDIHSNLHAFDACLADARAQGAQRLAILGDMVGYGAFPAQVVQRCQQLAGEGAPIVRGNHEALAVQPSDDPGNWATSTSRWTSSQLSADERVWLSGLPLTHQLDSVFLVHADAAAPERWRYVDVPQVAAMSLSAACEQAAVRYVFGGHVHHQMLYYGTATGKIMRFDPVAGVPIPVPGHRRWLATVGSVGQPRDGDPRAAYALLDLEQRQLTFHRIHYDYMAAAQAIRDAGLPDGLARRLETGR
jgi:diadenosine tetraphosphatase ApaH/serine/threonine PP2A family protein phosphatase